jgi:hypothetical protein
MKILVSLDPGNTTGIAVSVIAETYVNVYVWQETLSEGELRDLLRSYKPDYIVCESFEYRNKSRAGLVLTSRNLIGIVNLYVYDHPECRLFMQSPAAGKSFFTDDKLKKMELYSVGLQHGRDAMRHFLRWYKFGYGAQYDKQQPITLEKIVDPNRLPELPH